MKRRLKQISMPRPAIEPRNPIEKVWFTVLDILGKPRPQED